MDWHQPTLLLHAHNELVPYPAAHRVAEHSVRLRECGLAGGDQARDELVHVGLWLFSHSKKNEEEKHDTALLLSIHNLENNRVTKAFVLTSFRAPEVSVTTLQCAPAERCSKWH